MELIHTSLNILLPLLAFFAFFAISPLYLVFKFLYFIKRLTFSENVAGKVVLITGAASGIGKNIAYEYAKRGARLALVDIKEDNLDEVSKQARHLGSPDVISIRADVSRFEDCKKFIDATVDHFGKLDHLINNAGIARIGVFGRIKEESELHPVMDVNFWGSVYSTRFALPHLMKSKGKIVVIASIAGWFSFPGSIIYNASKAALIRFFETLRTEVGSDVGITVVAPGLIDTDLSQLPNLQKRTGLIPRMPVEKCAKAIVKSACRGDKYITEPLWMSILYLGVVLFPDLVEYLTCLAFFGRHKKRQGSSVNTGNDQKKD